MVVYIPLAQSFSNINISNLVFVSGFQHTYFSQTVTLGSFIRPQFVGFCTFTGSFHLLQLFHTEKEQGINVWRSIFSTPSLDFFHPFMLLVRAILEPTFLNTFWKPTTRLSEVTSEAKSLPSARDKHLRVGRETDKAKPVLLCPSAKAGRVTLIQQTLNSSGAVFELINPIPAHAIIHIGSLDCESGG